MGDFTDHEVICPPPILEIHNPPRRDPNRVPSCGAADSVEEAELYFQTLGSPYAGGPDAAKLFLEVRAMHPRWTWGAWFARYNAPNMEVAERGWFPLTPDGYRAAAEFSVRHGWKYNLLPGILPRIEVQGDRMRGRNDRIPYMHWLWCDIDSHSKQERQNYLPAWNHLERAIDERGVPEPHMIVASRNGIHAYWKLAQPVDLRQDKSGTGPGEAASVLKRLMYFINGHPHGQDKEGHPTWEGPAMDKGPTFAAATLRVPGTYHLKQPDAPPFENRLIRCDMNASAIHPLVWWKANMPIIPRTTGRKERSHFDSPTGFAGDRFQGPPPIPNRTLGWLASPPADGTWYTTLRTIVSDLAYAGKSPDEVREMVMPICSTPERKRMLEDKIRYGIRSLKEWKGRY